MADLREIYSKSPSITPLDKSFRFKPKGQFFLFDPYLQEWTRGGDYASFSISMEIEEEDVYSNEYPERVLDFVDITQADLTVNFTARMQPMFLRRASMLSKRLTKTQVAVEDVEFSSKVTSGGVLRLPHMAITEVAVAASGAGAQTYVEGTHFSIDKVSGFLVVLRHPDGVVLDVNGQAPVDVVYSAAAFTREAFGFLSQTSIQTQIAFRQKVKFGPQVLAVFHRCQIRPDGEVGMGGDGSEFGEMSYTCRVFADPTKSADFQLGEAIDLPRDLDFDLAA